MPTDNAFGDDVCERGAANRKLRLETISREINLLEWCHVSEQWFFCMTNHANMDGGQEWKARRREKKI